MPEVWPESEALVQQQQIICASGLFAHAACLWPPVLFISDHKLLMTGSGNLKICHIGYDPAHEDWSVWESFALPSSGTLSPLEACQDFFFFLIKRLVIPVADYIALFQNPRVLYCDTLSRTSQSSMNHFNWWPLPPLYHKVCWTYGRVTYATDHICCFF